MHFYFPPQKTHPVWFIRILNYGDTENVLINHLLLVIPMSYPCHYTNLCLHKPHKHAHTHTHAHTHARARTTLLSRYWHQSLKTHFEGSLFLAENGSAIKSWYCRAISAKSLFYRAKWGKKRLWEEDCLKFVLKFLIYDSGMKNVCRTTDFFVCKIYLWTDILYVSPLDSTKARVLSWPVMRASCRSR